jgi:hypothetical protein
MRGILSIIGAALLATFVGVAPAMATPGGDQWVTAQQSEQMSIVNALNADLTTGDGQLHSANCYSMYQLRGHTNLAAVSIRGKAKPAACGNAKAFGIHVLRKVQGHWAIIATSSGAANSVCTFTAKVPASVTALLAKTGPCYAGQG